jgi:hypothetical protein
MKRFLKSSLFIFIGAPLCAAEVSLYYLPGAQVEYEGTGYRETSNGWELKVKPQSSGMGLRWRQGLTDKLALQVQGWANKPFFATEDGNAQSDTLRQTGQTKLAFQTLMADLRRPLSNSSVEVLAGLVGFHETFHRKDIVFNLAQEPGCAHEAISALGAYFGFHGGHGPTTGQRGFYWDGEATMGHFFFTDNKLTVDGGSIHRNGYTYTLRLEGGWCQGSWRAGMGYLRQLYQVMVQGGQTMSTGAAASLPINKTDFFSPFVVVSYVY